MWQVVGYDIAVALLNSGLKGGKLSHAYLLVGPPHVGKMTLASNLAQALNCQGDDQPCGVCASCQRIAHLRHADVQVIGPNGRAEISIDQIREMERSELWNHIGYVPQKAFLFTGTVASNLRYGDSEATDEELWHALSVAQAKDFVEEMSGGLDEPIVQSGSNVSGGQRQRLAIARALVKKADVYIFDDSFSALDLRTDSLLRAALKREASRATVLVVAQRVSSIMQAEQIVVLDEGTIAGLGSHDELLETCETYREIVYSQLSAEEAV